MSMLTNCEKCKRSMPKEIRQQMGCGYETPVESPADAWKPPSGTHGYQHEDPVFCAGYVSTLPEVIEAGRAWVHWDRGQLQLMTGPVVSDLLLHAIETIDVESSRARNWLSTPADEGGGGK